MDDSNGRKYPVNGDGRLLARIDQKVEGLEEAVDGKDGLRDQIIDLRKRVRDLEDGQLRIVVIGSLLFGVGGVLGPSALNALLHVGGH